MVQTKAESVTIIQKQLRTGTDPVKMALAQLVERSFRTQEVCSLNLVIANFLFTVTCVDKDKIKKKMPGIAHF